MRIPEFITQTLSRLADESAPWTEVFTNQPMPPGASPDVASVRVRVGTVIETALPTGPEDLRSRRAVARQQRSGPRP